MMEKPPRQKKVRLMLDSGAYTVWTKGEVIDIDEYIEFIKKNLEYIETYVNLDAIPGKPGVTPTLEEVEASAQKSWENLKYMEAQGLHPIPVFHQGERFFWLDRLLLSGYTFIGISPTNGTSTSKKQRWLDEVFTNLTTESGLPVVKTHGFGVSAFELLFRYPWRSYDSLAWIRVAAYGGVYVPRFCNGQFIYDKPPYIVKVSDKSAAIKEGRHFENFSDLHKQEILAFFLAERISYQDLKTSHEHRATINVRVLRRLKTEVPRFLHRRNRLV